MRKLFTILIIGLSACTGGTPYNYKVQYVVRNSSNLSVKIYSFKDGNITKFANINSQEMDIFSIGGSSSRQGSVAANIELRKNDSVRIEFADGKFKTDYLEDYISSNTKSIFRDEYYIIEYNCGNYCSQYIYTIDEQDYAEAK